jgi:hypothetical protein
MVVVIFDKKFGYFFIQKGKLDELLKDHGRIIFVLLFEPELKFQFLTFSYFYVEKVAFRTDVLTLDVKGKIYYFCAFLILAILFEQTFRDMRPIS